MLQLEITGWKLLKLNNMYYFLYGTDTHKAREKLHSFLDLAKKKRPDAEVFKMTSENWSEGQFDELLISQGLFEQKYTVVLDNLFEQKEVKEYVLDRLEQLKDSDQIFLFLEGKIDSVSLKKIEKYSEKVQEFEKKTELKKDINVFGINDGLLDKDKKKLWMYYLNLLSEKVPPEEIHGILFWQVKSMILASRSTSSNETGLSPFVYKNALRGSRNYKTEDLQKMSMQLVDMTHQVRTGEGDLGIMLEKWILCL
jgi:DNA polymerase III delta subunit